MSSQNIVYLLQSLELLGMNEDVDQVHNDREPKHAIDQVLRIHLLGPLDPLEETRQQTTEQEEDEASTEVDDVGHDTSSLPFAQGHGRDATRRDIKDI
jgi:hypothetical protein